MIFNNKKEVKGLIGAQSITISTGELAKQAHGSVLVQCGETIVLGTATMGKPLSPNADFLPLLVEYDEKFYAAGKIKGSRFMKREGKPHDDAILTARFIDRSIRPLFPEGMINDVQVVLTVLSYDGENDPDVLAMIGACGALMVSGIPWEGPLGAVRVGLVNGVFVVNPTMIERASSSLDLLLAGSTDNIVMIEAGAMEVTEQVLLDAFEVGQKASGQVVDLLVELQQKLEISPREGIFSQSNTEHVNKVESLSRPMLTEKLSVSTGKDSIAQAEKDTVTYVLNVLPKEEVEAITEHTIRHIIHVLHGKITRDRVLEGSRSDGRALDEVRPLSIQAGILPRAHGTGLFQRGDTQVLTVLTLGGPDDALIVDTIRSETKKRYIHYYNFPAFSVGEIRPSRGPGRREIGHGALAERALLPVLPAHEVWPYTMLLFSEVLESNGSSSMASVCGSSLALMDAGVPITRAVAGIAMGLVSDGKGAYNVLTDIAGMEDEKGDMDFKVAGTAVGVTALQMDIKVIGLNREMLTKALEQARKARMHILEHMNEVIEAPRKELSTYAPRIHSMRISVEKIGDLIGPKGKNINEIIDQTGASISVEDDGMVFVVTSDGDAMQKAITMISDLTREIVAGDTFQGKVVKIMDFGAFVQLVPNVDGLVHISQFTDERVADINDIVKVGDVISVVVLEVDALGRINLSHKATKK